MTLLKSLILICCAVYYCLSILQNTLRKSNMDIQGTIVFMILCPLFIFLFLVIVIWYMIEPKKRFAERTKGICCWICWDIWRSHPEAENPESLQNMENGNMSTRTQEISSTRYQERPIDIGPSNSSVIPQNVQQSLRVNLPPEIILTPSQHIITNQEYDKPPSYESLYNLFWYSYLVYYLVLLLLLLVR